MRREQLQKAKIIASSININRLKTLTGNMQDEEKTDFQRIKYQLKYIRESTDDCRFIYLMKKNSSGDVIFLIDSQIKGSEDYAPPGLVYTEIPDDYMPAFNKAKEIAVGPIKDRWGKLFTALIPIKNPESGSLLAVLGMDYNATKWNSNLIHRLLPVALAILLFMVGITVMVLTSRRLKSIVVKRTADLNESKENFKTILNSIGDAVIATDIDGNITNMNPIAEKLTAYSLAESKGKPLGTVFHIINATDRTIVENPVQKVLNTGQIVGLANHTALLSKDGKEYQIADSGAPIINKNGERIGVVLVFRDETEKYHKERQIRESEAKFKSLAETTSVGIMVYNEDKWVYANQAAMKISGYTQDELKQMHFWDFVAPDYQQIVKERGQKRQHFEKTISRYEFKILTKQNEVKWVFLEGTSIIFEEKPSGLVSIIDITEDKKNEKELRISKERYKVLFEQAADGILVGVQDGTIIDANPNICDISGYRKDELIGANISMLFPPKELTQKPLQYNSVIAGKTILKQRVMKRKNGELIDVEMNTSQVADGRLQAYIRDISKRMTTERLKREKDVALKSNQMKHRFLANMSHDMRTPLTGIIGFTDLLLESKLNKTQSEYTAHIKESSEYLLNLVNDVLDISSIEEGKMHLVEKPFQIINTIEQQLEFFKNVASEKGLELKWEIDDSFPSRVIGDKNRFRQVITNLLSNAVKYTNEGGVFITLEILKHTEKQVEGKFVVNDTGIGISKEFQEHIFNVFSRADDSKTKQAEGSGLGLAISKEIVKMMNGEINVESKENQGSRFWFTFAVKTTDQKKEEKIQKSTSNSPKKSAGSRILLVEDKLVNQKIVKLILEKEGYIIDIANNGLEALDKYTDDKYDVILMDIMMPKMDGITAMNELNERFKKVPPIIGLSAYALEGDAERFIKMGMDDYLEKPVNKERLIQTLNNWIQSTK